MSYSKKTFAAILIVIWAVASNAHAKSTASPSSDVITIEQVVAQVQDALTRVEKQRGKLHIPKLKSVDLTLQTIAEKQVGGTFKLWVISFGAKKDYKQTQEMTIHLSPPNANNPTKVGAASVTEALEATIISAAQGVQNAGSTDYPLSFTGLTVSLALAVQNDINGGGTITIAPVSIELSGKASKSNTQTLKIVFDDSKTAEK